MLWIVFFHVELTVTDEYLSVFKIMGYGGVDIFMFASGVGVYFSYVRDHDPAAFICRRIKRLAPVYLPFIILWCVYKTWLGGFNYGAVIGNLFGVQGFTGLGGEFNWYITGLAVMYLLAFSLAYERGEITRERCMELTEKLQQIPEQIRETLQTEDVCQYVASKLVSADSLLYIGRGLDYALSMEGSLKLKEISYIHSESYAAGELKHGTISLITDLMPVVAVVTQSSLVEKTISNMKEVKARGAKVTAICRQSVELTEDVADHVVKLPDVEDLLMPMIAVVPLQLIAYYTAVLKGCDVDKPRNLAKSVTVE